MAILEKETKRYYKVAFEECTIMGLTVYVSIYEYATKEDRDNEKVRKHPITKCINKIQQRIDVLQEELTSAVSLMGKTPEEIMDELGLIVADQYPELRAKQDELMRIQDWPILICQNAYRYGDNTVRAFNYAEHKEELEGYGFKEEWVNNPIHIVGHFEGNCGPYKGEPITTEFFYNRFKKLLVGDYIDC